MMLHFRKSNINGIDCCEIPECTTEIVVPGGEKAYSMDYCIIPELKKLWDNGIKTVCSCCGHGDDDASYIRVDAQSVDKMDALGYVRCTETHECLFHVGSICYRPKTITEERLKGGPYEKANLDEIQERWKKAAHYGG